MSYSIVIEKLAVAKNFDGIETLMLRIKGERKCRLSDKFFRNVIKIYGNSAGRINKAIETLFDMPNNKCWPSTTTFNFVLNLLVSSKQFDIVPEVYSGVHRLGVEIDTYCLNIIIKGLCECGRIEDAFKVLDEFPEQNCKPNVRSFSTIMHGLCQLGRVDEGLDILKRTEMEGVEPDSVVFNILISGFRKPGRAKEAIDLFDKIKLNGCNPNPATYQEVLYCFLDEMRFIEAKVFMDRMIEKCMNPSYESYKFLLQGICRENSVEDVEWALNQMVAHGFVPRLGTWNCVVRCGRPWCCSRVDRNLFWLIGSTFAPLVILCNLEAIQGT